MNVRPEHLEALHDLGFTEREAAFLYLVATHSGYFTQQQFLDFIQTRKGDSVSRFVAKALRHHHVRTTQCAYHTHLYNLFSRPLYAALDRENVRNRRRHSHELIETRLRILDFVLAFADEFYLEIEADKVAYFRDRLGLPASLLPGRIYKGLHTNASTKRYFVDRFPILQPQAENRLSLPLAVTFTFCDGPDPSLARYITHLRAYENFLRRLPAFNFIYAAPNASKFQRARAVFDRLLGSEGPVEARHLVRYFQLRLLWEMNRTSQFTRADRDFLRDGDKRYRKEPFESSYRKWAASGLSDTEIEALLESSRERPTRRFQTYVLPRRFSLFERFSKDRQYTPCRTIRRKAGSGDGSTLRSTGFES
jgi:hypothetical protein